MSITKIATCCYCGTKAALVLRGRERHELACSSCGAPLRALKMLPKARRAANAPTAVLVRKPKAKHGDRRKEKSSQRGEKRFNFSRFGRKIISEIWDVIEDAFD
ncbi:hypothetical protein ACJ5NV_03960 [Loktanella agnita]|uniref:hypothetical protein n=1 Tax=Loktanella agnita TaxID=287097 RepID=UPI003987A8D1